MVVPMLEHGETGSGAFAEHTSDGTPPAAIGGALLAGIAGAAIWAGIAIGADYEIGWIAWGIGAAVGAAYHKLGGRAASGPVLCGAIALLSIAGGKYAAFRISVQNELEEIVGSAGLRLAYDDARQFGEKYAAAKTQRERDDLIRGWISDSPEDAVQVTERDLQRFREKELPRVQAIREGRLSYDEFAAEFREVLMAEVTFADAWGGFDLLWIFLGVGTAFRLAAGAAQKQSPPPDAEAAA